MYTEYKVLHVKTGQIFDRYFRDSDADADLGRAGSLSELQALRLVNKWNRQNATAGFVYWIE